jgi:hypothetical protein
MSKVSASAKGDLREQRKWLLQLSAKQTQLRDRLRVHLDSSGVTIGAVATASGLKWLSAKGFLDGTLCLSSGKGLAGLGRVLGCEALTSEIAALTDRIPDRHLGLGACSPEAIELAILLMLEFQELGGRYSMAEFAGAFGDSAPVALGALSAATDALAQLEKADIREKLSSSIVADDFPAQLAKSQARERAKKAAPAARLRELTEPLVARFGTRVLLAKALKLSPGSLHQAILGNVSLERLEQLIAAAEKLTSANSAPQPAAPSARPAPARPPSTPPPATPPPPEPPLAIESLLAGLPAEFVALAGATTPDGLNFVLTEGTFQSIKKVALLALADNIVLYAQLLRALLNVGAQVADDEARGILVQKVGRELEQLDRALRTFTFKYPNRLLALNESEQRLWAADSPGKPKPGSTSSGR